MGGSLWLAGDLAAQQGFFREYVCFSGYKK